METAFCLGFKLVPHVLNVARPECEDTIPCLFRSAAAFNLDMTSQVMHQFLPHGLDASLCLIRAVVCEF